MLKTFLLVFTPDSPLQLPNQIPLSRAGLTRFLDTQPSVKNWMAIHDGAIVIVSPLDVFQLSGMLRVAFPGKKLMVSEIRGAASDGWHDPDVWAFINAPRSSGRWP